MYPPAHTLTHTWQTKHFKLVWFVIWLLLPCFSAIATLHADALGTHCDSENDGDLRLRLLLAWILPTVKVCLHMARRGMDQDTVETETEMGAGADSEAMSMKMKMKMVRGKVDDDDDDERQTQDPRV